MARIEVDGTIVAIVTDEIQIRIELGRVGNQRAVVLDVLEAVGVRVVASGGADGVQRSRLFVLTQAGVMAVKAKDQETAKQRFDAGCKLGSEIACQALEQLKK